MATAISRRSSLTMNTSQPSSGLIHRHPVFDLSITPNDAEKAFTLAKTEDQLGQAESQLRLFAERVVPEVRASLMEKTITLR